jgi:hypothetical protein
MGRREIEAILLAEVERTRAEYAHVKAMQNNGMRAWNAAMGTPDDTSPFVEAVEALETVNEARERYEAALEKFKNFVLEGKLPPEFRSAAG